MDKSKDYLTIMIDSLKKKIIVLDNILKFNEMQKESVSKEKIDEFMFEETLEKKDICIDELNKLDDGFNSVYNRVKDEIKDNPELYKTEIEELKELISEITEKSMEVQISEKRNEKLVFDKLSKERQNIRMSKNTSNAAANYYKSMNKVNVIEPQFLDKKK